MAQVRRNSRKLLWLLCIGTMTLARADASSISLVSEDRFVSVANTAPAAHVLISGVTTTNTPAASFNNAWLSLQCNLPWLEVDGFKPASTSSSARQDVSVTTSELLVNSTLTLDAGGDPLGLRLPAGATGTARADSHFEVTFSVDRPTAFVYEFGVASSGILASSEMILDSLASGSQVLVQTAGVPGNGLLGPDVYTLRVHLTGVAAGDLAGAVSSDVRFAVLPEPSTVMLAGCGFTALLGLRRRR